MFKIEINYINFSAAHFLIGNDRERIHGHNYQLSIGVTGPLSGGMVIDFLRLEDLAQNAVRELDHKLLIPMNPLLQLTEKGPNLEIMYRQEFFSIPLTDIKILPISDITAELLAKYLGEIIYPKVKLSLTVKVSEYPGAVASYTKKKRSKICN
jgi:6-pyruvoyltetrahydropterin/6-carboxytetrahydropterin synthase